MRNPSDTGSVGVESPDTYDIAVDKLIRPLRDLQTQVRSMNSTPSRCGRGNDQVLCDNFCPLGFLTMIFHFSRRHR